MKKYLLLSLLFYISILSFANNGIDPQKKHTTANRIEQAIKIDGNLDDSAWRNAKKADGFIQNEPKPGINAFQRSEVRILYDNTAIYIGATLYDSSPDSIQKQLSERDNFGNTDWFGITIDAYQDGNNGVGFLVTPAGVQLDIKYLAGNGNNMLSGDRNWDAVWISETKITEEGWTVEMKIPYSAIRFPAEVDQIWNINFARLVRRNRELSYWSPVDPTQNGLLQQSGQVSGISNIKSPVRLSATPFVAVYGDLYHDKNGNPQNSWRRSFSGGMDVKYGINDAFTLDMTLIPDFGQVQSDNQVLNLSPFEVRFDENRQFFTEGVELFNKGNLFYSRRVGGQPIGFFDADDGLSDGETIIENPRESQLYNATKVSGRTTGGLGVGVFNAISKNTYATIEDSLSGNRRRVLTNPLTNYNVVVFDQNLKNNSYVTLINTNVLREGRFYDANTTGTLFNLKNKAQSYALEGKFTVSQKYYEDTDNVFGHTFNAQFNKISGNWRYAAGYNEESDTYDVNDLGFLFANNERSSYVSLNYNNYEPFSVFRRLRTGIFVDYERLYAPNKFVNIGVGTDFFLVSNDNYGMGLNIFARPYEGYDYFEPRTSDFSRFYRVSRRIDFSGFISSNYNKTFYFDIRTNFTAYAEEGRNRFNINFEPVVRVNDKFTVGLDISSRNHWNDEGFVTTLEYDDKDNDIIFGRRDNIEFQNILETTYTFNNKMSLTLRFRHYWAKAEYDSFHLLGEDGELAPSDYKEFSDNSFNSFTVDAVYRWRFAPGSDIFVVWKNNTTQFDSGEEAVRYRYLDGTKQLRDIPALNSLSFKMIYYLDYLSLKQKTL
jgi:hypothetical protein